MATLNKARKDRRPIRWVDICRVMKMMGHMEGYSKGECFALADKLQARIDAGKVERLSRGLYQIVDDEADGNYESSPL